MLPLWPRLFVAAEPKRPCDCRAVETGFALKIARQTIASHKLTLKSLGANR